MNDTIQKVEIGLDSDLLNKINEFSGIFCQKSKQFIVNILRKEINYLEDNSNDDSIFENYFNFNNIRIEK